MKWLGAAMLLVITVRVVLAMTLPLRHEEADYGEWPRHPAWSNLAWATL